MFNVKERQGGEFVRFTDVFNVKERQGESLLGLQTCSM